MSGFLFMLIPCFCRCNFLNYRRNVVCFHCEHKRPPDDFLESQVQEKQQGPRKPEKILGRPQFSNAWNFDFDDNESDGADVAAFEYADSKKMNEDFPLDKQAHGGIARGHEDGFHNGSRPPRLSERDYSDAGPVKPGLGFNDFDDEEDDLDNYELDNQNEVQKPATVNFSELEVDAFSEDEDTTGHDWTVRRKSRTQNKPSKSQRQEVGFSGSNAEIDFGSDDDLPIHPNWKSSHVNQQSKRRGPMSFGSDDELSSDTEYIKDDDFGSKQKKGNKWSSSGGSRKQQIFDTDDEPFSDLEPNNDGQFNKNKFSSRRVGLHSRGNTSAGRDLDRRRSPVKDNFSSRGSRGRRFKDDDEGYRMNSRGGHSQNFRSQRREGSYRQRQDRFGNSNKRGDSYLDEERHRRPRINVR